MATTVQDVFDEMLTLIDAVDDADVSDYENRTIGIINVLIGELFMYSDNWNVANVPLLLLSKTWKTRYSSMIIYAEQLCRMA